MRANSKNKRVNKDGDAAMDDGSDSDGDFKFVSVAKDTRGVARANLGYLEEARSLSHSDNVLAEFLINREPDARTLRLEIWRIVARCFGT